MVNHQDSQTIFQGDFKAVPPIPQAGIDRAVAIMESGRLHRYNIGPGEESETALLEKEFAEYLGLPYCVALSSCGSSLHVALRSAGVKPQDQVLFNAFTLAPVPGAIANSGALPVPVECSENCAMDLSDFEKKATETKAKFLLLSHMRGHISDMDAVCRICHDKGIHLIEDCAHSLGAKWGNRPSGTLGLIGCFSSQDYKHINSGEGGLLVTRDQDVAARAVLYSGSYMLYGTHLCRPSLEVFERFKNDVPNFSLRMSNLQAAILRPQIKAIPDRVNDWRTRYDIFNRELSQIEHLTIPARYSKENFVGSSFQFRLKGMDCEQAELFQERCFKRGVKMSWFGAREPRDYASTFENWQYISGQVTLATTKRLLETLFDMRISLSFSSEDCMAIVEIIKDCLEQVRIQKNTSV
jgi:dTDP-4-amino-4,6-dideoxygalactose transaminase